MKLPEAPPSSKEDELSNPMERPTLSVEESLFLLRAIFPWYPDLHGMKPIPKVDEFIKQLREKKPAA